VVTLIDEFVGVAPRSGTRLVALFEPKVYDIGGASETTLRFSDSRYATDSGHTPASTLWLPRFSLPSFRASLGWEAGSVGHSGEIRVGRVALINTDGSLDAYLEEDDFSWNGRSAEILLGGHDWDRADFDVLVSAVIGSISANDDLIQISLDPSIKELDRPLATNLYRGAAGALDFNGTTSKVVVGPDYDLGDGDATLEAWVKWSTNANSDYIAHKRASWDTVGDAGFSLVVNSSDQVRLFISDGSAKAAINVGIAGALDDDLWHHVAVVIDRANDEAQAYVNGEPYLTTVDISGITGAISDQDEDLVLGAASSGSSNFWDGTLDEFRIWASALTAAEIKSRYQRTMAGPEERLIGHFSFDEYGLIDSGATALNSVGGPTLDSVLFDAAGEDIDWGNNKDSTTGDLAFGIWFKAGASDTSDSWLLGKRNSLAAGSAGYGVYVNSGTGLSVEISDGTNEGLRSSATYDFRDGRWYAAVVSIDRTADTLDLWFKYLGGEWQQATQLDISGVTGSLTNAVNLRAGHDGGGTNQFLGQVSHAFYCAATLTAVEAQGVMDGKWDPPKSEATEPPVISTVKTYSGTGYWPMDEGTGTTITDNVASVNGTASGGTSWVDRHGDVTGGTWVSTLEGGQALRGSPKPLSLGRCKDVPCVVVEPVIDRILQFNTPEIAASEEVEDVRIDGLLATLTTDYTVDLTASTIDASASAKGAGVVTADVKGLQDSGGDWMRRTGRIAKWLLNEQQGLTLETDTDTDLDELYPYEIGVYLRSDEYLTREALALLFQAGREAAGARGRLFWTELFGGSIRFSALRDLTGEAATLELTDAHILAGPSGVQKQRMRAPVWKVLVGWERVWHDFKDFLGGVDEEDRERMSNEYRWEPVADVSIKDAHEGARVLKLATAIYRQADAKLEAQTLFDLLSVPRPVYVIKTVRGQFQAEIGDVVKVTTDQTERFGLDSGKLFTCIGYSYNLGGPNRYPVATLELWGGF